MSIVVGVDPGGRTTGVVSVNGSTVVYSALVTRTADQAFGQYALEVVDTVRIAVSAFWPTINVEDLVEPTPHLGLTSVKGLIDTARLIGYLEAELPNYGIVRMVRPNNHGGDPLAAYPPELVGSREKVGTGKLRHVRAAYDIARTT